jgi:ribosomal protein S18 acetylase RimI-like enzyme
LATGIVRFALRAGYAAAMQLRPATAADREAIWTVLQPVIRAGETYALDRDMSREAALAYWLANEAFVAEDDGAVVGTYYLRPNQAGGGAHVCNCGYMVSTAAAGRGVARAMCAHSLEHARRRGYRAMQFNFVVGSNVRAVHLWESMGFEVIGRVPGGFEHPRLGFVDALMMYQEL